MLKGNLFKNYAPVIKSLSSAVSDEIPDSLLIEKQDDLSIYYAPFDWTNTEARVVLVGITPGLQQATNAINAAHISLNSTPSLDDASKSAKNSASFSGSMRNSLIDMLNYIGLDKTLNINSCDELFGARRDLVHYTSVLRYPVFFKGKNYSGSPDMTRDPLLQKYLLEYFSEDAGLLPNAIWIPLGPKVTKALKWLSQKGIIDEGNILSGLPHPSGANAERIAYFLDRKSKEALSIKTNAVKIDEAKQSILTKMITL